MTSQTATEQVLAMTREDRDRAARAILESPLYLHTFDTLETYHTQKIVESEPADQEIREEAYRAIKTLRELRRQVAGYMKTERMTNGGRGRS